MHSAAFLDRDGTIIEDRGYLSDPDQVALLPGVAAGLQSLRRRGYLLVVVSNQSGVARGLISPQEARAVHDRMVVELRADGVELDGVYYCPHGPDDGCRCRKPRPGLFTQAIDELHIDPARSIAIGDRCRDLAAGLAAGAGVLVRLTHADTPPAPTESEQRAADILLMSGWPEFCAWLERHTP